MDKEETFFCNFLQIFANFKSEYQSGGQTRRLRRDRHQRLSTALEPPPLQLCYAVCRLYPSPLHIVFVWPLSYLGTTIPATRRRSTDAVFMLAKRHRRHRRWANIESSLFRRLVFAAWYVHCLLVWKCWKCGPSWNGSLALLSPFLG